MSTPLVSVIIPTYNRFEYLLCAVASVKNQTYENIEIIVVNDNSSQPDYYTRQIEGVTMIHLDKNSRVKKGYPCAGYVRNQGCKLAQGEYLAFLDDDDIWLPNKIETQLDALLQNGNCQMSSTDGYIGKGIYNPNVTYKLYNKEFHFSILCEIFRRHNASEMLNETRGFQKLVWDKRFLEIHNCVITSSVMVSRKIFQRVDGFPETQNGSEDYGLWLKCLDYTNMLYVEKPCFYYDDNHAEGNQHHTI